MGEHRRTKTTRLRQVYGHEWEVEGLPIPWWYWTTRDPRVDDFVPHYHSSALAYLLMMTGAVAY